MSAGSGAGSEPRRTILVVDDAPMFREIETLFLARSANVLTACDGPEALAVARSERPDLVLTDLTMCEMDGDELCRELHRDPDLRSIPVVVVTSGRSAEEHERAIRAGANDVIEKPLSRISLLQVTRRFLDRTVRGLDRVPLETEVRLSTPVSQARGWSRNVSRGGIFVELDAVPEPDTEFDVEFQLPDIPHAATPTARVAWRRPAQPNEPAGMGLQFLKLDRETSCWLEQYVYELGQVRPAPVVPC